MQKLIFLLNLVSFIAFNVVSKPTPVSAVFAGQPGIPSAEATQAPISLPQKYVDLLPAGYTIPKVLPGTIQDPLLLTAWVYLYNQQDTLSTWDGRALSGRRLAQYVLDQQVSVQWNATNDVNGDSYTRRPACEKILCRIFPSTKNSNPIMITTAYQYANVYFVPKLAGTIAHECIHHMLPFGNVPNTKFEEYWAFSIGYQIPQVTSIGFDGYDPLKTDCLEKWFSTYWGDYYASFPRYPQAIEKKAETAGSGCTVGQ